MAAVLFGRPAYLLPVMLGVAAWRLTRAHGSSERQSHALNVAIRSAGFVVVLVSSCALAVCTGVPPVCRRAPAASSAVRQRRRWLRSGLDMLGATLLLLAAWMAGAAVAFGVSWFTVMDRLGAWTWSAVHWTRERWFTNREVNAGRSAN
jgi:S-DNA-T family DNA segregation ATPase FtsK/SpoIIIE